MMFNKTTLDFGEAVNITVTVENKGKNLSGEFPVSLVYSYNESGRIRKRFIVDLWGNAIPPEDNVTYVSYVWSGDNHRFIGVHNITVEVDAANDVSESNEQNNKFSETIDFGEVSL